MNIVLNKLRSEEWLGGGRMFIGLEISGAGAQTLFERQAGVRVSEPNVIGVREKQLNLDFLRNFLIDGLHSWAKCCSHARSILDAATTCDDDC